MRHPGITADDYKTITIGKLVALLQTLPQNYEVWASRTTLDLCIGDGQYYLGYLDIATEELVVDEEENPS